MDKQTALNQLVEALGVLSPNNSDVRVNVGRATYEVSDFTPKAEVSIDGTVVGAAVVVPKRFLVEVG